MKKNNGSLKKSAGLFSVAVLLGIIAMPIGSGHNGDTIYSRYTDNTPTLDGEIGDTEWEEAAYRSFTLPGYYLKDLSRAGSLEFEAYVMSDEENLYIAVVVTGDEYDWDDLIMVTFDHSHDGNHEEGEDFKSMGNWGYGDNNQRYYVGDDNENDLKHGGTTDGWCELTYDNNTKTYVAEFEIPLDSGDELDISVEPGDTIGFGIAYIDQLLDYNETVIYGAPDDASVWANLVIGKEKNDDVSSMLLIIIVAAVVVMIIIIAVTLVTMKKRKDEDQI